MAQYKAENGVVYRCCKCNSTNFEKLGIIDRAKSLFKTVKRLWDDSVEDLEIKDDIYRCLNCGYEMQFCKYCGKKLDLEFQSWRPTPKRVRSISKCKSCGKVLHASERQITDVNNNYK